MIRYLVAAAAAGLALLLLVTFARALPSTVEQEKTGRQTALRAVCEQVLRPETSARALGGTLPRPAPDFKLKDHEGHELSLASYRGRVVLLNFWATWCPTCVVEMPSLERLVAKEKGQPFSLVAVSVDDNWDDVRRFFRDGTKMTVLLDKDKETPTRYGTSKFPETFVIDKEGNVRFYVVSDRQWDSPGMLSCMQSLMDS